MKYMKYIRGRFNDPRVPAFKITELKMIKGLSGGYLKLLMHNLISSGEVSRITRGTYTFHKDAFVVGFGFQPFYYGLENAFTIRNLSDQMTNPTVMTVRNVRRGLRRFKGRNYLVYHIDPKLFFGYDLVKYGDFWVPVSDPEKTIIDMIYFKNYIRDDVWENLSGKPDKKKIAAYVGKYPVKMRKIIVSSLNEYGIRNIVPTVANKKKKRRGVVLRFSASRNNF